MHSSLCELNHCRDVATLRGKLNALCAQFGSITRLEILDCVQAGRRQAMCFLRLESADQEKRFSREFGVGRFGGDLVVVVDLKSDRAESVDNRQAAAS